MHGDESSRAVVASVEILGETPVLICPLLLNYLLYNPTVRRLDELVIANREVLDAHKKVGVTFSCMSEHAVFRIIAARGLTEGRALLPASLPRSHGRVHGHAWSHRSEVAESPALLAKLRQHVLAGAAPIDNVFLDVQSLVTTRPMRLEVEDAEGTLEASGGPHFVVLRRDLDDSVIDPLANACIVGDWKTTTNVGGKPAECQVMSQAIALTDDDGYGYPTFLTDFVTGFRCWLVIRKVLFHFHPSHGWLTLAEGTALVRYFITHGGRMKPDDQHSLLERYDGGSGGGPGGSGGMGGSTSGGRGSSSSGRGGRGGGGGSIGGSSPASGVGRAGYNPRGGPSALRRSPLGTSARGQGTLSRMLATNPRTPDQHYEGRLADHWRDESSSLALASPDPSPTASVVRLSPAEIAAYQRASIEEFASRVRGLSRTLSNSNY